MVLSMKDYLILRRDHSIVRLDSASAKWSMFITMTEFKSWRVEFYCTSRFIVIWRRTGNKYFFWSWPLNKIFFLFTCLHVLLIFQFKYVLREADRRVVTNSYLTRTEAVRHGYAYLSSTIACCFTTDDEVNYQCILPIGKVRNSWVTKSSCEKWRHTSSYLLKNFYRNSFFELLNRRH